jgi:hypothetical protein
MVDLDELLLGTLLKAMAAKTAADAVGVRTCSFFKASKLFLAKGFMWMTQLWAAKPVLDTLGLSVKY